jgi:hypothetical protein
MFQRNVLPPYPKMRNKPSKQRALMMEAIYSSKT